MLINRATFIFIKLKESITDRDEVRKVSGRMFVLE